MSSTTNSIKPRLLASAPPLLPPTTSNSLNNKHFPTSLEEMEATANLLSQTSPTSSTSTPPIIIAASTSNTSSSSAGPKAKKPRRSKVAEACKFCRRSHMSCDAGRPCSRCVKRDIAHLCRVETFEWETPNNGDNNNASASTSTPTPSKPVVATTPVKVKTTTTISSNSVNTSGNGNSNGLLESPLIGSNLDVKFNLVGGSTSNGGVSGSYNNNNGMNSGVGGDNGMMAGTWNHINGGYNPPLPMLTANFNLAMLDLASGQDGMGTSLGLDPELTTGDGEFHGLGLSEFLQSLNATSFPQQTYTMAPQLSPLPVLNHEELNGALLDVQAGRQKNRSGGDNSGAGSAGLSVPGSPINKTERFLLTAADQKDGSRSDRLARVIHAKFEAGLLRPYNHVAGYTRLMRWMGDNMSQTSRQRTLHTLSEFRPAFRAIASGLTDLDLVFIEEAFERLLLDYDRVFSSMGIPSCLWRRTGEIYKGNKEFAALVGVPIEHLQGGKLAIYELMAEESAVNYWEKYGNIAFDAGQKAVLTSCVLINQAVLSKKRKKLGGDKVKMREEAQINCCFSFTIRRDSYAIPSMIVGNFLKY